MRKDLIVAALGFLVGAAALAGGQEEDWELSKRLQDLQETIARLRQEERPSIDRLPPMGQEGQELELFPVFDLTAPRNHYMPHDHRLRGDGVPLFGGGSESIQPVGTVEEIMELVRGFVWPQSYEEGATLNGVGQTLVVLNTRAALIDTAKFLEKELRDKAHRCVSVEVEAIDVPRGLYRGLAAGKSTGLTADQHQVLAAALEAGQAQRVFGGRVTGFVNQNVVMWHGRQVAVVSDAAVEVAQGRAVSDPEVSVVQAGGTISVRPSLGEDAGRITLEVQTRYDELEEVRTRETEKTELVEMPEVRHVTGRATVTVANRTWAVVGGGASAGGMERLLLLRATILPRMGGGR